MKKWHKGLKVLAVVLSLFLAFPCGIVSAAAKPDLKIKHDPPKDYVPGFRITLDTKIKEKADVLVARCYFKTKKDKNLVFVDMVPKGNPGYQATLPAPWVGSEYIDYAFVVVNKDKEVIRTQMFRMEELETEAATTWQEATEVKEIQVDKAQEAVERYETVKKELKREYKDKLPKYQRAEAIGQLDVLTEFVNPSGQLKGFYDNMIVTTVPDSQKYGVLAEGLYTPAEIAAAGGGSTITASTGAVTAGTVKATGVIGLGTIALGALGIGGIAALAGAGGGGSSSSGDDSAPPPDGKVTSRDVEICVIDHNNIQDDFYDLYVNGVFIGTVNNAPGETTCYNAHLKSGSNKIVLKLTETKGLSTLLRIAIEPGGFSQEFSGTHDHTWYIEAP